MADALPTQSPKGAGWYPRCPGSCDCHTAVRAEVLQKRAPTSKNVTQQHKMKLTGCCTQLRQHISHLWADILVLKRPLGTKLRAAMKSVGGQTRGFSQADFSKSHFISICFVHWASSWNFIRWKSSVAKKKNVFLNFWSILSSLIFKDGETETWKMERSS